jgi:hypothetical protein
MPDGYGKILVLLHHDACFLFARKVAMITAKPVNKKAA